MTDGLFGSEDHRDDREKILDQLYMAAYIAAEMGLSRAELRYEIDRAVDVIEDVDTSMEVPS
jgi:hypothetical protein